MYHEELARDCGGTRPKSVGWVSKLETLRSGAAQVWGVWEQDPFSAEVSLLAFRPSVVRLGAPTLWKVICFAQSLCLKC
jgi:hypothetical protein